MNVLTTLRSAWWRLSLPEQWVHGVSWLIGLVILNWPGQRITIVVFHSEELGLLVPTLYGSLLNAALCYLVIDFLVRNGRPYRFWMVTSTLGMYVGFSVVESLVDVLYYQTAVGTLNLGLLREIWIGNALLNFVLFYLPALVYGIVKGALVEEESVQPARITIQDGHQVVYVQPNDLTHLESDGNYVKFYHLDQVTLERNSLTQVMERLPAQFIRCHKSFVINSDLIDQQSANEVVIRGNRIPVGRKFKENLKAR